MIDLHTHSTASDGTDTPAELIAIAVSAGVTTLAITDHDTTAGWVEATEALCAVSRRFTLIRGAEFSCVYEADGLRPISLHLLGYLFDPDSPELAAERAHLRQSRLGRGEAIVDNLAAAGYPISWDEVVQIAGGGAVGRPHIGQALVNAAVVSTVTEAFTELLGSDSPYYVRKLDMDVFRAVDLIRTAGGVPVIAHPWARRKELTLSAEAIAELAAAGLRGIEIAHLDHNNEDRAALVGLSAELGLFATGSSDYHGTRKSVRIGAESTDPAVLEQIVDLATGAEPISVAGR